MEAVVNPSLNCLLNLMTIVLGGIQKHRNKCQDIDQCIFIPRASVLQKKILTTATHQMNPSSITKSKSAKKEALLQASIDYLLNIAIK